MRISQFYCLQWFSLTILCTIFIIQEPTFFVGISILIIISSIGIYLYVKGKQHASVPLPKSTIIIGFFSYVLLAVWILIINPSSTLFIGVLMGMIVLLYIIQQFMDHLYVQALQIQQLEKNIEQFNESYHTVSAQRHDFMKHVLALAYLLEKENVTEAKVYMQHLISDYQWVNQPIAGEQGHIASLLLYYQQIAHEQDVTFHVSTDQPLARIPLSPHEQVQLIGNLLENAVDAAKDDRLKHSYVTLHSQIVSGLYKLEVTNSTKPIPNHIIDYLFSNSRQTTKTHGQGIGTTIIANLVNSSDGTLKYTYYGTKIVIRITLPMLKSLG